MGCNKQPKLKRTENASEDIIVGVMAVHVPGASQHHSGRSCPQLQGDPVVGVAKHVRMGDEASSTRGADGQAFQHPCCVGMRAAPRRPDHRHVGNALGAIFMTTSTTHVQDSPPPGDSWAKCARCRARYWKGQWLVFSTPFETHGCCTAFRSPRVSLGRESQDTVACKIVPEFLSQR